MKFNEKFTLICKCIILTTVLGLIVSLIDMFIHTANIKNISQAIIFVITGLVFLDIIKEFKSLRVDSKPKRKNKK